MGVAATSSELKRSLFATNATGFVVTLLARSEIVCAQPGTFIDFAEGTRVEVVSPGAVTVAATSRRPTEDV